jgi:YD repeat-containing protein
MAAASLDTAYDLETNDWETYLPVKGDVAKTEEIDSWTGTTPIWITITRATYDPNGRVAHAFDALNRETTTSLTPATAGPVTSTSATNALGHTVTTSMVKAWQLPASTVDANNARTDLTYDGLGRLLKVWLPGRPKATKSPNLEFAYLVRNAAPTAVTTKKLLPLDNTYKTSITLYDGMLRERQTQTQTVGGGRVIKDSVHDSRGLLEWSSSEVFSSSLEIEDYGLIMEVWRSW